MPVELLWKFQNSRRVEGVEAHRRSRHRRYEEGFRTLGESKALKPELANAQGYLGIVSELSASRRR